jgi:amino acid transporter
VSLVSHGNRKLKVETEVIISIVVLVLWALKNRLRLDKQGWFSNTSAVYQMLSTIFIAVMIVIISPKLSETSFVFTEYNNDTGFSGGSWINIYVCCVGVLMSLYGISGYDSGAAMSEETENGEIVAPKGIIEAVVASSITGFVFLLGLLYACQNDIAKVLNGPTD